MFSSRSQKLLQCGNYFHYEITKETKSCQLLRQCPSLVPSPRYFGRRFLFRFTWSSRGSLSLWLQRLGDMDVRRKTTAQAFAILTAIDLKQTNEQQIARCYDKKQNKTEEQQQKWITAAWLFVYISDGFQCDLSKLLTVWDFVNNLRFLSDKSYGWNLKIVCSGWVNW